MGFLGLSFFYSGEKLQGEVAFFYTLKRRKALLRTNWVRRGTILGALQQRCHLGREPRRRHTELVLLGLQAICLWTMNLVLDQSPVLQSDSFQKYLQDALPNRQIEIRQIEILFIILLSKQKALKRGHPSSRQHHLS